MSDIESCPTCGARVQVVGRTTKYYKPVMDEAVRGLVEAVGTILVLVDPHVFSRCATSRIPIDKPLAELRSALAKVKEAL